MDASVQCRRRTLPCLTAWYAVLVCALMLNATGCASSKSTTAGKTPSPLSIMDSSFMKKPPREIIDPEAGLDEFDAAVAKYEAKEYEAAIKDFKAIAKKFYDYPVEEDALYMIGECRFAQQRYAYAQDAYDGLIKKYPSTRYLEKSTRRLYAIGAIWLNGDGTPKTDELLQVSATDVTDPQSLQRQEMPSSIPLAPNLFDKSKPLFDTPGNALKALKSVWLHDPLGPLADDAVMLTAIYYIRKGNYREADHYLDILRREYPKSNHSQAAFVVGSHIKLANYQGPRYDGRDLIEADDLIHSTLNLYPNVEDREGLKTELVKIRDRGAERYWSRAEYYKGRAKPQAEAIYCETIINLFPDSEFANKAKSRLQELGPKYWTGMLNEYPDTTPSGQSSAGRKAPVGVAPKIPRTKAQLSAPPPKASPKSADRQEPQYPVQRGRPTPPPRKPEPTPKLFPGLRPREASPIESDDNQSPPSRQKVDAPEFVEGQFEGGIEQTGAEDSVGRARP